MSKLVIVINGQASAGKDTICDIIISKYNAMKVSAIDPIVEIAIKYGWDGIKNNKSRKFLSDLKRAFVDFNDMPNKYLLEKHKKFISSAYDILFVHIREKDQIESFIKNVDSGKCITLLIQKDTDNSPAILGNYSDDNVFDYSYDYYYVNNSNLNDLENKFLLFFEQILMSEKMEDIKMRKRGE
jgi:hypothetical protein